MEHRRDMNNILLSGLLSLHTAGDAAWHSHAREVSHLRCLGLPCDLSEDTGLLKHLRIVEEVRERVDRNDVEERPRMRRKRHLYVVPDPPDAA
jgi:hypothetical protein